MSIHFTRRSLIRGITAATAVATLATGLAACGGDSDAATRTSDAAGSVTVGQLSNGAAKQTSLKVSEVKSISAELPKSVKSSGKLEIGIGALPAGFAPLAYVGSDQKTLTGAEPDLGRLVAAVLGLKPELKNFTWENLFVGIDSGKVDVGVSNVTDTEERKKKYEFASYRKDNLGFEVLKSSKWSFDGNYENLAGKTVSVGSRHQPGEAPPGVEEEARGRGQEAHRQVLPGPQRHLPGAEQRQDRHLLRAQPGHRLPRHPVREHTRPDAQRGHLFRRRRLAPGPDRGHRQEGQRPGQARRRRHQLPDQERSVREVAEGLEPLQRGRRQVRGQSARTAAGQLLTRRRKGSPPSPHRGLPAPSHQHRSRHPMSSHVLDNPAWAALTGPHAHFAERVGRAARYPADMAPFHALAETDDPQAWADLAALVGPGGTASVRGVPKAPTGWETVRTGHGVQLVDTGLRAGPDPEAVRLGPDDVREILDLVDRTEPGPYLPRTVDMGTYLGIRHHGRLIAMAA